MTLIVTDPVERVRIPAVLEFMDHQTEAIHAFHAGVTRAIWRWHRQAGKGLAALGWTAMAAFSKPGTYMIASPTNSLGNENYWSAIDPDSGRRYIDLVFPPQIVLDTNENEKAMVITTAQAGKTSRIIFRSADDPDRLRGPAYAGVVLDEFATMPGREPLDIVRIPVERAGGWLLITSTPRGLNHFYEIWKNAEQAGGWYCSTKTIEDTHRHDGTPIIPLARPEQERREGQSEAWLRQELWVEFTAALVASYYGDLLTKAEAEGRIGDYPHRPERTVWTAWDLGMADAMAVVYMQEAGEWLHLIDADEWTGASIPDCISRVQAHGYVFGEHLGPHDLEVRDLSVRGAPTRKQVAAGLGFKFRTVPRVEHRQEAIDALRRLLPRVRFDRRRCARLLQALAEYQRVWDAKGKCFRDAPLHSWASHLTDAMHTLARGYRERPDRGPHGRPTVAKIAFDPFDTLSSTGRPASGRGRSKTDF